YVLAAAVLREAQRVSGAPPDIRSAITSSSDPGVRKAGSLAKAYFEVTPRTGKVAFPRDGPPSPLIDGLQTKLAASAPSSASGPYKMYSFVLDGSVQSFVAGSVRTQAGKEVVAGFQVDADGLARWIKIVLERRPLLPPSLGHGKV